MIQILRAWGASLILIAIVALAIGVTFFAARAIGQTIEMPEHGRGHGFFSGLSSKSFPNCCDDTDCQFARSRTEPDGTTSLIVDVLIDSVLTAIAVPEHAWTATDTWIFNLRKPTDSPILCLGFNGRIPYVKCAYRPLDT